MSKEPTRPVYSAGIVEGSDNCFLIVREPQPDGRPGEWSFPRCPVLAGESPEEAMRRLGREQLGLDVEIIIGQPPLFSEAKGGGTVELRYFFCGIAGGEASQGPYEDFRWIAKPQLCEYDFDWASREVVQWLLEQ